MKRFEKRVKWNFKLAISGYGRTCKEALMDALLNATQDQTDWAQDDSMEAIEAHEVSVIDEDDFEDEE